MQSYDFETIWNIYKSRDNFCVNSDVEGNLRLLAYEAEQYCKLYFNQYKPLMEADNILRQSERGLSYLNRFLISMVCEELNLDNDLEFYDWHYLGLELKKMGISDKVLLNSLDIFYEWTQLHVGETKTGLTQKIKLEFEKIINHERYSKEKYPQSFSKVYCFRFRKEIYDYIMEGTDLCDCLISWYMADASVSLRSRLNYHRVDLEQGISYFEEDCKQNMDKVVKNINRILNKYLYDKTNGYYAIMEKVTKLRTEMQSKNVMNHITYAKLKY